jgi:hypothetical protein
LRRPSPPKEFAVTDKLKFPNHTTGELKIERASAATSSTLSPPPPFDEVFVDVARVAVRVDREKALLLSLDANALAASLRHFLGGGSPQPLTAALAYDGVKIHVFKDAIETSRVVSQIVLDLVGTLKYILNILFTHACPQTLIRFSSQHFFRIYFSLFHLFLIMFKYISILFPKNATAK